MIDYVVENATPITLAVIGIAIAAFVGVKYVQHVGMESIREKVYQAFLSAEHEFKYGDNTEKFEYVINIARNSIPMPFSLFITESLLRKVVQAWFDLIKDLLDDGKLNGVESNADETVAETVEE